MSRNLGIFIIILALSPIIIYFILPDSSYVEQDLLIEQNDKVKLLEYSHILLEDYFQNNNQSVVDYPTLNKKNLEYDILFITLLDDGKVRGCQSGSNARTIKNRLFLDIKEAMYESIEDERFGGVIQEKELSNISIMFTFLYNMNWLYNTSLPFLQNTIEVGFHAIEIFHNGTPTIFKESVPISNNYNLEETLNRLCNKANLADNCYKTNDIEMYRYDTLTFMRTKKHECIDLYRYSILIDEDEIDKNTIHDSITLGYTWFLHSVNDSTNLFEYMYYPSEDEYSLDNNHLRQLASIWSLSEMQIFLNKNEADSVINTTLDYYLNFSIKQDDILYIEIDNQAKIANNAFLILILLNTPEYDHQTDLLDKLGNGIISLQHENGSYHTDFLSEDLSGVDYYPGEAMLSLMKLYEKTRDKKYVDSVTKAFSYYKQYWRQNKNTAFIPWHTQTYALLYKETKNLEIANFIFEMNDWLIEKYQMKISDFPDEIGGFPKYYPTFSTSVFIEGITDAYEIAVLVNDSDHMNAYRQSIKSATRFIIQLQFTQKNSFYIQNKTRTIGGFKTSLSNNSLRIDNIQHSTMALMKTYENNIFR